MEIKVSVIVPVYNPGDGFEKCVGSLMEQSLREIEFLFVDDMCTDGSMEYLRACALRDPRIRMIRNPQNMGPGCSRNRGIEEARGEYLSFVDADDYVPKDALETLYSAAAASSADIAKGLHCCVDLKGRGSTVNSEALNVRIRERMEKGLPIHNFFTTEHQAAVYRRDFLLSNQIRYGTSCNSEDAFFLLQASYAAKKIRLVDRVVYFYVEREGSRYRDISVKRAEGELISLREMMGFKTRHGLHSPEDLSYIAYQIYVVLGIAGAVRERDSAADGILSETAELILANPWAEELRRMDAAVDAFASEGINLASVPATVAAVPFEHLCRNAEEWVRYMCGHSPYSEGCVRYLNRAVERAALCPTAGMKKRKGLSALRRVASRLDTGDPAMRNFLKLRVFLRTGLCLYGVADNRAGAFVGRILKEGRKKT